MGKLKYFIVKNKVMIGIITIILICAIAIAIGVFAQVTNRKVITNGNKNSGTEHLDKLKEEFDSIFTNQINIQNSARQDLNYDEIIYTAYDINDEKATYNIQAKIPLFKIENDTTKAINKDIYDLFVPTIINIVKNSTEHTTFNLDYVVYVNNNILSLAIRCIYKDGSNPQREIIKTYNYNLENQQLMNIDDILNYKQLNKEDVQKEIIKEIEEIIEPYKNMNDLEYPGYKRNIEDKMYKIENTQTFFIGSDNYLYIVYAYGNNNYTRDIDLVIF